MPSRLSTLRPALLALTLSLSLPFFGRGQDTTAPAATPPGTVLPATLHDDQLKPKPPQPDVTAIPTPKTADTPIELATITPIKPDVERDYQIGHVVGSLLEQNHYLQTPITPEMSQKWLKNYLNALDYNHLFFLQSDVDEFTAKYGNNLGDLLLHGNSEEAAIAPAFDIFNRYLQRLRENVVLAEKLVHEKYDFTKDETYTMHTNKSPWIQTPDASQGMWRGQIEADLLNGALEKKTPAETIKRIAKRYASLLQEGTREDDLDVIEFYYDALARAYDPHSDYFQPDEAANFNIQAINHSVTGIGAVLKSDDGYATIEQVIAGGPADLDKRLQSGDRIIAVGQGTSEPVDAVNMKLNRVVDMIRGDKGSVVHLVIAPAGAAEGSVHKDIILKRDLVSIKDSLAKAHIIVHTVPGGGTEKFGVIFLHDFYSNLTNHHSAVSDVTTLIKRLKKEGIDGLILDMRGNGGGLLDQAVDLTGLFANDQPVVQIRTPDGNTNKLGPQEVHQIYDGPLVVMVNKMSASATEIVAAALQDYGRAIIVGDQSTHGKGTVQTLIPLEPQMNIGFPSEPGPGNLKMTVQKFYRVAGGSTQQKGVIPDIVLPSVLDALELGETTLPYYLPYDEVAPVPFDHLNLTAPYLPLLSQNSAARVAASPDFAYLKQDVSYYKKKVQDSTVSLNEAARIKEQSDLKSLAAQRKKDLAARQAGRDKELELTLDMVEHDLPAAPPTIKKVKEDGSGDDMDSSGEPDLNDAVNNPTDDPQLDEAVNIMADYTQMLRDAGSKLVQTNPAPAVVGPGK